MFLSELFCNEMWLASPFRCRNVWLGLGDITHVWDDLTKFLYLSSSIRYVCVLSLKNLLEFNCMHGIVRHGYAFVCLFSSPHLHLDWRVSWLYSLSLSRSLTLSLSLLRLFSPLTKGFQLPLVVFFYLFNVMLQFNVCFVWSSVRIICPFPFSHMEMLFAFLPHSTSSAFIRFFLQLQITFGLERWCVPLLHKGIRIPRCVHYFQCWKACGKMVPKA